MNQLFVYGTLRPNHENAHLLERIGGTWQKGYVHGVVHILDWAKEIRPLAILKSEIPSILTAIQLRHCSGSLRETV
jgi:gamma-glutamylcyclotransferase (GGCT)/AIG2-like uncharacterized protein YtfP